MKITREMVRESAKQCAGVWSVGADPFTNTAVGRINFLELSGARPYNPPDRRRQTADWYPSSLWTNVWNLILSWFMVEFPKWGGFEIWTCFLMNSIWTVFELVELLMDIFRWFGWALCAHCMVIAGLWTTLFVGVPSTKRGYVVGCPQPLSAGDCPLRTYKYPWLQMVLLGPLDN